MAGRSIAVKKTNKPSAADRTIDIFTGKTPVEIAMAASEVIEESFKGSETIEQAAERWRSNAFFTQEFVSKNWGRPSKGTYRITHRSPWYLIEQFQNDPGGKAYGWKAFMVPEDDLEELTGAMVKAYRERP